MSDDGDLDFGPTPTALAEPEYRIEGPEKVTGATKYVADLNPPGTLWAAYRRSDLPHARIVRIEATRNRLVSADPYPCRQAADLAPRCAALMEGAIG